VLAESRTDVLGLGEEAGKVATSLPWLVDTPIAARGTHEMSTRSPFRVVVMPMGVGHHRFVAFTHAYSRQALTFISALAMHLYLWEGGDGRRICNEPCPSNLAES
jgi:hypothetical protein